MMTQANMAELRTQGTQSGQILQVGFDTTAGFEALQRMAKMFNSSSIVPKSFQGENNIGSAAIALDMAIRMRANPLMVMQNLYTVHGSPAWSAQFLIATLNQSGKFSALRYEFQGTEGNDDWGCRAVVTELSSNEKLSGPLVTIGLAKKEGWYGKSGSKWQSMPELMLRYRAASWFVRSYAPEIAMGLPTAEEARDTIDLEQSKDGVFTASLQDMKAVEVPPVSPVGTSQDVSAAPKCARSTKKEMDAHRDEARQVWLATGRPIDEAEKLVNAYTDNWSSAQCTKIMAEVEKLTDMPTIPQQDERPTITSIPCPKLEHEPDPKDQTVYTSVCESCQERKDCPSHDA